MEQQTPIDMFTKPNCSYCTRAKKILKDAGLAWREHDVTSGDRIANASVYLSGLQAVPQIFIGGYHVRGADDLERLAASGTLARLVAAAPHEPVDFTTLSDTALAEGAADVPFRTIIPKSDGARDDDREAWPILRFYKQFFGFWPNTFAYLHHWPEAYKLFMYGHNFAAIRAGRDVLGDPLMLAVGYGTSQAQGCNYCQAHSAAFAGEKSRSIVSRLRQGARNTGEAGPIGDYERALVRLAARASHNTVTDSILHMARDKAGGAYGGPREAEPDIEAVALVTSAFGFLNVFNGLVGMQIEGDWAKSVADVGVEAGRHGAEETNPDNLDYAVPQGGPTLEEMIGKYQGQVGDLDTYSAREFGVTPTWMAAFPESLRKGHAAFYGELMGDRAHSKLSAELKHLLARVSAIAKGHDQLAATEAFMAHHAASDQERAIQRIRSCYAVATARAEANHLFTRAEQAALRLAWLSAQVPLTTPRRFVAPAIDIFDTKGLIEIFVVAGIASLVQRFVAIKPQKPEVAVLGFLAQNNLEADTVALRYPLPRLGEAA